MGLMIAMTSERYVPGIVMMMMMMTLMMIMIIMFQVLDVVWMISQD